MMVKLWYGFEETLSLACFDQNILEASTLKILGQGNLKPYLPPLWLLGTQWIPLLPGRGILASRSIPSCVQTALSRTTLEWQKYALASLALARLCLSSQSTYYREESTWSHSCLSVSLLYSENPRTYGINLFKILHFQLLWFEENEIHLHDQCVCPQVLKWCTSRLQCHWLI